MKKVFVLDQLRFIVCLSVVCIAGIASGCGGSGGLNIDLVPVSGKIMMEGEPLQDASVVFESAEGTMASGKSDSSGRFELQTRKHGTGAPVGEYTVRVLSNDEAVLATTNAKVTIPLLYEEVGVDKVTVPETGTSELHFDLKRKPKEGDVAQSAAGEA